MRPVWIKGNQVDLLESGQEFFPSLLNEIENAQTEIILFTYIFKNDRIGTEVGKRLKSAALRNVAVTLVIDGFGSGNLPVNFIEDLRNSKVQILVFRAFHRIFSLRKLFFRRLHQKIVVIDQKIAFVGGINIDGDQYEQLDYALRVSGPVVIKIYKFAKLLICKLRGDLFGYLQTLRIKTQNKILSDIKVKAAFAVRDNIRHRRQIEDAYLDAIRHAKTSIIVANAYFLPGFRFRRALMKAAKRGVRVRLFLQGRTDHPIVRNACALLYRELIRSGIEIIEYHRQMLHAKVATIDGRWATVGSCNLDFFSLFLCLEANLIVEDTTVARALEIKLEHAIETGGVNITTNGFTRGAWAWAMSWLSLFVLRIIRFLSGV